MVYYQFRERDPETDAAHTFVGRRIAAPRLLNHSQGTCVPRQGTRGEFTDTAFA